MAESVNNLKSLLARAALCGSLALAAFPAASQETVDPTRPPNAANLGSAGPAADAGPVLQSVLISPGRKIAVISGKEVLLGGRYGKAKVVGITESEVVLREGNNVQKLKLFPAIDKRKARPGETQENG